MNNSVIIEYMEENIDFAKGIFTSAQEKIGYAEKWKILTNKLNSLGLGQKPVDKWQKIWSDFKNKCRAKAAQRNKELTCTGGGVEKTKPLSELEERVIGILGPTSYKSSNEEKGLEIRADNILIFVEEENNRNVIPMTTSTENNNMRNIGKRSLPENDYNGSGKKKSSKQYANESVKLLKVINSSLETISKAIGQVATSMELLTKQKDEELKIFKNVPQFLEKFSNNE